MNLAVLKQAKSSPDLTSILNGKIPLRGVWILREDYLDQPYFFSSPSNTNAFTRKKTEYFNIQLAKRCRDYVRPAQYASPHTEELRLARASGRAEPEVKVHLAR